MWSLTLLCLPIFIHVPSITAGSSAILKDLILYQRTTDLEFLLSQTITSSLEDTSCVAIFCDEANSKVFGSRFFTTLRNVPSYFGIIEKSEDLLAPNYKTLQTIKAVRRSGCGVTIIFLNNGEKVGRFLRFGDRYRQLDTRANFVLLHDRRLLDPGLFYLWKKIVNVLFIRRFATRPGVASWYELLTVPFPSPIPEVLRLRRLDTWRGGTFKQNALLFRDKTSDLRGQSLRAVTFQHIPAAFKMPAPATSNSTSLEGKDPVGFGGLEIEVLTALSKIMNFDARVYEVPDGLLWGQETNNGSYTGLIGEVADGRADFALGDLHHTPHHLRFMDLTIPYNTQCLTFLTPESLSDNSWQTLIVPFKGYMWTGVLISLVIGSVMFYALARFQEIMNSRSHETVIEIQSRGVPLRIHDNFKPPPKLEGLYQFSHADNSLLYSFSMLLLVSLPKLPTGWSLRVLTGCWWMYSILVAVAYRASMTAILANPAPRVTIDTLEQLAESKISAGGWGSQIKKFFQTSLDDAGKQIGSKFEMVNNVDDAMERVAKGEFAYYENIHFLQHAAVRRQLLKAEAMKKSNTVEETNDDRNLHIMSSCVIYMPISLGLQKNSPLKPRVDRYLRLITQAGLVQKWLQDAMTAVLIADRSEEVQSQKALMNLKKFLGALVALGVGYGISCFVLIIEIIYWHFTVVRDPFYDRYANTIVVSQKVPNTETKI